MPSEGLRQWNLWAYQARYDFRCDCRASKLPGEIVYTQLTHGIADIVELRILQCVLPLLSTLDDMEYKLGLLK